MDISKPIAADDGRAPASAPIGDDEIRAELSRILHSPDFRSSRRRRDLFGYLVEETLAGRGHLLKGYTIGISVFGRPDDFDARADPVVRLEAHRLRRDLAAYYVAEGRGNPLRITVPKGHYVPEVARSETVAAVPEVAAEPDDGEPQSVAAEAAPPPATGSPRHRLLAVVAALAALAGLLLGAWWFGTPKPAAVEAPRLMVMPFEVLGSRPEDTFLAVGIADQIVTELTRFPDFRLYLPVPPSASEGGDAITAARQQGITYAVAGSVSSDGSAVRIGGKLVEVASGRVLWAGDYDRPFTPTSLLAVQSEISSAIASTLGQPYGVIKSDITDRLSPEITPSMPSYECVLRSYAYRRNFDPALHAPLMACLQRAVERDPRYADAWAMLGWLQLGAGRFGLTPDRDRAYAEAFDSASHAVGLDDRSIVALKALASIDHYRGNYAASERVQRRALALNPNDPDTLAQLGWRLAVRGNFKDGIPYLEQAIQRTMNPPGWYFHLIAVDDYLQGRFDEMLKAAQRGTTDASGISWSFVAIAEGALGDRKAARDALDRMAAISPRLARDPAAVYRGHQAIEPIVTALTAGLRQAGWTAPPAD